MDNPEKEVQVTHEELKVVIDKNTQDIKEIKHMLINLNEWIIGLATLNKILSGTASTIKTLTYIFGLFAAIYILIINIPTLIKDITIFIIDKIKG